MTTMLSTRQKVYLLELLRRIEPRLYFALVYHLNTSGRKLTFQNRPYIIPIYKDKSIEIVVKKSVQCGISEWLIIETLTKCDAGFSVFYVLPKYEMRNTFVANRIDKLFNMVPFYRGLQREAVGHSDSRQIKHFSLGTVKFASSNTISDFSEFPADVLIIDEMDRCDQNNLSFAEDRLKASRHKLVRKVANPTITGIGISDEFKWSDQKEWLVECGNCKNYNELDFFRVVVEEIEEQHWVLKDKEWTRGCGRDIYCICPTCNHPFDRLGQNAYWGRMNPMSEISGYHISRMMDPETSIQELWKNWGKAQRNESKKQVFYNSDLGIEYESKGSKLTDALLDKCVSNHQLVQTASHTILGCDVGSVLHVHISDFFEGKRRKLFIGTVPGFTDIDNLIKSFGVTYGVVDALPETHAAKQLRDRFPGKIWLCEFHGREGNTQDLRLNDEEMKVVVDRTQIFDETHADILNRDILLPQNAKSLEEGEFYKQMCAPTRVLDPEMGRYVWREGSKSDHHRLADIYEKIAMKIYDTRNIFFGTQKDGHDIMPER